MLHRLLRALFAAAGGTMAAALVALIEARAATSSMREGGEVAPPFVGVVLAEIGILFPVAVAISIVTLVVSLITDPTGTRTMLAKALQIRNAELERRIRAAAVAPLVIGAILGWVLCSAHLARRLVGFSPASVVGLSLGISAIGVLAGFVTVALAAIPVARRMIAAIATMAPPFADPWVTGGLTLGFAVLVLTIGFFTGDTGGGTPGIGIFGVLRRPELDLRPIVYLLLFASGAYAAQLTVVRRGARDRRGLVRLGPAFIALLGTGIVAGSGGLCARAAFALNDAPLVAEGVLRYAPLGSLALKQLRKATDRDRDGHSALFGGADCNDHDKRINPTAIDIPGNGIDEDCSGADTPLEAPTDKPSGGPGPVASGKPAGGPGASPSGAPDAPPPVLARAERTYNVILITVDTLRFDLGFAGYPRPVTPNIDALAEQATIFERAYSAASYTAKAMGSMMIGRYPSEADRDYDHYTVYFPTNTFLAKRLQNAGVRTFAGTCHYYFNWGTGYKLGFDVFDASAIAPGMGDGDASITSDRMTDLAIKLLSQPANTSPPPGKDGQARRFFTWYHYFDPHAQYVPHAGAPDFGSMPGPIKNRGVYDQEVWFTDKHIGRLLDYVKTQPWAADTAVIITADHGEAFGDHGVGTHGHELWEPLIRVPLVVYVPGARPHRIAVKRAHIDLVPTILELTGAASPPFPSELRGSSLVPDIFAPVGQAPVERDVYMDMPEGPYNETRRALIYGQTPGMKLIHFGGKRYRLYDLAADPAELRDLSGEAEPMADAQARLSRIRSRLDEKRAAGH